MDAAMSDRAMLMLVWPGGRARSMGVPLPHLKHVEGPEGMFGMVTTVIVE